MGEEREQDATEVPRSEDEPEPVPPQADPDLIGRRKFGKKDDGSAGTMQFT